MATVTHADSTSSTANASTYASNSFTPALDDLLVAFVGARTTVAAGTMTSSVAGQTFSKVNSKVLASGAHTLYCFVSDRGATATAQTLTFDCTGDAATAGAIHVCRVASIGLYGLAAVRQSAGQDNQAAAGTPAPAFAVACLTDNVVLGAIHNASNPAGMTPPGGTFAENADTGNAENLGLEYVESEGGFTGTTVTWGSASATNFASLIVEINVSRLARQRVYPQILPH